MIAVLEYIERKQQIDTSLQLPSIRDMETEEIPDDVKEKILDYMFNGDFRRWYVAGGYSDIDAFTGKPMLTYSTQLNDGEYTWFDNLALYVKNHDVKLPQSFIEHVMAFYAAGGEVHPYFDWRTLG